MERWGSPGGCHGLAVFLLLTVAVAACGDDADGASRGRDTSSRDDVVPFERRPAKSVEPSSEGPAGPEVPECTADTVTFEVLTTGEVLGGESDAPWPEPDVRNLALIARPGERCGLSEYPSVRLTTSEGQPDTVIEKMPPGRPMGGRLLLADRQRAIGFLRWTSSCVPDHADVQVEAQLVSGDVVSAPLFEPPACDPAAQNTAGPWMTFPAGAPDSPLTVTLADVPERHPSMAPCRSRSSWPTPPPTPSASTHVPSSEPPMAKAVPSSTSRTSSTAPEPPARSHPGTTFASQLRCSYPVT